MSTAPAAAVDWERIEFDYRAGVLSLRELAAAHPATNHVAISRRAKKEGWTRDLSAKIKAKADDLVTRSVVTPDETAHRLVTEKEVVEAGAAAIVQIRLSHRTDIQRSKRIANSLLEHLESMGLPKLPEGVAESELQVARNLSAGVLKDQTAILGKLVDTQKVLVAMEREAFGIAKMVEDPEAPSAVIDQMEGARRLAFALARATAQLPKGT